MLTRQRQKGVGRRCRWKEEQPRHKQWESFRKHRGTPGYQTSWEEGMCCPVSQLDSRDPKNSPDVKEDIEADHRTVKAGKKAKKSGKASRKPIKHPTDFNCNYMQTSTRKLEDIYSKCERMKLPQDTAAH